MIRFISFFSNTHCAWKEKVCGYVINVMCEWDAYKYLTLNTFQTLEHCCEDALLAKYFIILRHYSLQLSVSLPFLCVLSLIYICQVNIDPARMSLLLFILWPRSLFQLFPRTYFIYGQDEWAHSWSSIKRDGYSTSQSNALYNTPNHSRSYLITV